MDSLFDDRVCPATERLACPILMAMEISLDRVAAYVDVVEHIPGMAQSEAACVVRESVEEETKEDPRAFI